MIILLTLIIAILLFLVILSSTGKWYVLRGIKIVYLKGHTSTYIDDWPNFANAVIASDPESAKKQSWKLAADYNRIPATQRLIDTHKKLRTVAYLIIQNNQIRYEKYADGYGQTSKTNSFSIAKSMTVSLVGKAIEEGYLEGLRQPVADFYPEFGKILTIGDLASMASGMKWNEDYNNPFSSVAQLYLEKDLRQWLLKQKLTETPGKKFDYNSGNTQLLGMILEKATGQNVSAYLSTKFWQPMGMQEDALWELDSASAAMEKTYCCIASNARDFARFGRLYMQRGEWENQQLLNSDFVELCLTPRFSESPQYGYGFWLSNYLGKSIFAMQGILGQYVIGIPEDELLIVRLGHKRGKFMTNQDFPSDFYIYIDETYAMLK